MNTTLPNRPAANLIRFDADCFAQVGTKEVFTVSNPTGWGYPVRFESRTEAEAHAKRRNRTLRVEMMPVMARIKWN